MPPAHQPPLATTALIYLVVIALIVWRMARPQRMSVTRLWVMPIVLLAITGLSIWANAQAYVLLGQAPPPNWEIAAVLAGGAVLGVPLGFLRGRHSEVRPTERAGVMYVHSSPLIVMVWLAAFIARAAVRAMMPHSQAGALGADGALAFAMAALITSYYAIYVKYRGVVQQAPGA